MKESMACQQEKTKVKNAVLSTEISQILKPWTNDALANQKDARQSKRNPLHVFNEIIIMLPASMDSH